MSKRIRRTYNPPSEFHRAPLLCGLLLLGLLVLSPSALYGQQSRVTVQIDTNQIKIGEQISYQIEVKVDSATLVHFPEGQTFAPLETVEALPTDTLWENRLMLLKKKYLLTQFDSGAYHIPSQQIAINERAIFTDSFAVRVANVAVDTTKQGLYDIKPLIKVKPNYSRLWLWLLFGGLLLGGGLYYWYLGKRGDGLPLFGGASKALPPFDQALAQLQELEKSRYLIEGQHKAYYSELTAIVRNYLEEEAGIEALESTSEELITLLEMRKDAGELPLEEGTLEAFKEVLRTADLVKFARHTPENQKANEDTRIVQMMVEKTQEALPEPDEESQVDTEEYLREQRKKKRRKEERNLIIGAASLAVIVVLVFGIRMGFLNFWHTVSGHETKSLLEGEWVNSTYGFPPVNMETPEVLLRDQQLVALPPEDSIKRAESFEYSLPERFFRIETKTVLMQGQKEVDMTRLFEEQLKNLEAAGAMNVITKQEEFITGSGVTGLKLYGSGDFRVYGKDARQRGQYALLVFGGKGFRQQIYLTWLDDDPYAKEIIDRVLASIDVKTQV